MNPRGNTLSSHRTIPAGKASVLKEHSPDTRHLTPDTFPPSLVTHHTGFTLIELLVVIAIIAILNAILLPMVPMANDRANIAVCESNLRQISLAARMYVEDCGDLPPELNSLYTARYVDDPQTTVCSKTGQPYWYQSNSIEADRSNLLAACVPYPQTRRGKRPHSFKQGVMTLTLGGTVKLRTD